MNIPQWLAVLATVLGVASILGAVIATFRASYSKARIEALREDNVDLRARVLDLEEKEERAARDKEALHLEIRSMNEKNRILEEMVLQRVEITSIADVLTLQGNQMTTNHQQSMELGQTILEALQPWTQALKGMRSEDR